jgi:spermidine/putrescine-binding protein
VGDLRNEQLEEAEAALQPYQQRRTTMKFSLRAAALAASFIGLGMTYAQAQSEPLTVFVSGGAFADAMIESFVKPF